MVTWFEEGYEIGVDEEKRILGNIGWSALGIVCI